MVWWLKPWCTSMRSYVQTLVDVCNNISCIDVIYKHSHRDKCRYKLHVHHGEWCENILVKNIKKKYSKHSNLSLHAVIQIQFLIPWCVDSHFFFLTCVHCICLGYGHLFLICCFNDGSLLVMVIPWWWL